MNHRFGDQVPNPNSTPKPPSTIERSTLPASADLYEAPLRGDYPSEVYDQYEDLAKTIQFYIAICLKRKWLILASMLVATTVGATVALMQTPQYRSTVRIQIEQEAMQIVESGAVKPTNSRDAEFLSTQLELIRSRAMATRVASALQLENDKGLFEPTNMTLVGLVRQGLTSPANDEQATAASLQTKAASILQDNISVTPVRGSRLVDISYSDPSPARAARISNAYADAYVASNIDKRFQANAYAKTFLEDQIQQLKIRLEKSEKTLLEFSEQQQIVRVNDKSSIAENNLAAANAALGKLISERIKNEQSWKQVKEAEVIDLPQLLTNSVIDGLRGRRNTLTTEYQEKLETFKPSYPAMVQIANKIEEIDRQLKAEVETIRASLKAAYESSAQQENEMKKRISTLRTEVIDLQKKSVQYNILKREVESNRNLYNSLLQRFKEVDVASGVSTNNVFIVDRARQPEAPYSPRVSRSLILAFALGLGGGIGLATLLEMLDDTVHSPDEIEQISGLATLGIIPKAGDGNEFLASLRDPHSAVAEAYRSLATALQFSTDVGLPRSIAVTSAGPSEGKSSTALGLARHFSTIGMKVLLVDGDLRKPSLHNKLQLQNNIGLTNYLTGAAQPPEVIQATDIQNLAFMATGPLPPNAAELLSGTKIYSFFSVGLEVFDLIIIDSPPLLGLADAQLLSTSASATVFVVASGKQKKNAIKSALGRLQLARAKVIGSVLTHFDPKSSHHYGYGYGAEAYTYGSKSNTKAIMESSSGSSKHELTS